jgi:hypothetical protein
VRAGNKERLGGLARKGYCASLKRWFHGTKEHLIFTPRGNIALVLHMPGNRHDVQGLYALAKTSFKGTLLADTGYWPRQRKRKKLEEKGIEVFAQTRSNWRFRHPKRIENLIEKERAQIERRIGLFNAQFNAGRTLCRSRRHYEARRAAKALAHNASRRINKKRHFLKESVAHFHLVA